MEPFKNLSVQQNEALLKFPAYISLPTANNDGRLDEAEKKAAIKIAYIKTFSGDPILAAFFREADKVFENNIGQLDNEQSPGIRRLNQSVA